MKGLPARDEAWALLCEHVKGPNLRCHSLAVEAVMRHAARKRGEDEDAWGAVGFIHDVGYGRCPDEHLKHAPDILRAAGWSEELIRAEFPVDMARCRE